MRITPLAFRSNTNSDTTRSKRVKSTRPSTVKNPGSNRQDSARNVYYQPLNQANFTGLWLEKNIIKKVLGKQFQGLGLYKDGGSYIDFLKVGAKNLAQESLDITKATDNEVYAYWHANALSETYESSWVRRYNSNNVSKPLATFHTLNSQRAKATFAENLKELLNTSKHKALDVPITDKSGKLSLDCVVFDTETTGLNIFDTSPNRLDKIVQIGALQVKGGKVVRETAYNQLINPGMPIPEAASNIHGITDEAVKDQKTMKFFLKDFVENLLHPKNGPIVAYNSKFDITILNNAIRENNMDAGTNLKQKQAFKVLDPFILIQRIHPYLGVRKKLGEQYKFLFAKTMDNAHDAFADVEGTVDVLKYSLYYLSEHRKNKSVPLSVREVLAFQNGGKVENIDLPMDMEDCNAAVNFKKSYIRVPLSVDNYFKGYKLTKKTLEELSPEIGLENIKKLQGAGAVNHAINLTPKDGFPINPAETKRIPNEGGFENSFYVLRKNVKKLLGFSKLEPFNGKTKDEIEELIIEKSKQYIHEDTIDIWMKNTNPKDIKDGNDLADLAIARRVMSEK
jgi:DNA polymerase-3 subunit epsilon